MIFNKTSEYPNKILISGEHSAVYGGWSLAFPVIINNLMTQVNLKVDICPKGKEELTVKLSGKVAKFNPYRENSFQSSFQPLFDIALYIFSKNKFILANSKRKFIFNIKLNLAPKGTGNSASISAAFTDILFEYFKNKPTKDELFQAAIIGENGYHGGKASGTDLNAVISTFPQLFRKVFLKNKTISTQSVVQELVVPKNTSLLIVDSYLNGEKAITSKQIEIFAKNHKINLPPIDLSETERKEIVSEFNKLVMEICGEFYFLGNAKKLGQLFLENHSILAKYGVSSDDIDKVIKISINNGAYGAKLIGAGGVGGVVLVICPTERIDQIRKSLSSWGFKSYHADFLKQINSDF